MALSKKALLQAKPRLRTEEFEVAGFDEPVRFRELSTALRLELTESFGGGEERTTKETTEATLGIVVLSLVDENDEPLFTREDAAEGVEALMAGSMDTVQELIKACFRVNGMTDEEVKDAAGNSGGEAN